MLAERYGYSSLQDFVADIPEGADVADVGAGQSILGLQVCRMRRDVSWLSIDQNYDKIPPYLRRQAWRRGVLRRPRNFDSVTGNALNLTEAVGDRRFDLVLSYWMLPHIIIDGHDLGLAAADSMLRIAKPTGVVAVGPCAALYTEALANDKRLPLELKERQTKASELAMAVELSGYDNLDHLAEQIVTANTLSPSRVQEIKDWADRVNRSPVCISPDGSTATGPYF